MFLHLKRPLYRLLHGSARVVQQIRSRWPSQQEEDNVIAWSQQQQGSKGEKAQAPEQAGYEEDLGSQICQPLATVKNFLCRYMKEINNAFLLLYSAYYKCMYVLKDMKNVPTKVYAKIYPT